ncbi:hypothetical protein E4T44_06320 [Aureobasidium sp. EXF-8845]|nr:hypothetical protein E4T44_06320 [Aureobasidium sp. EXF-8845]KAI4848543.1 hypothetical protein E4T45_06298 [Aureobasidium sp. EXF-8846]
MALQFPTEIESLPMDRSAGFHHKVVDGIEDLLLVLAEDGRISYASPKSFSLIQVKSEAMVGQYISTYMNVDDIPVFLVDFKEHMASGTSWRSHHRLRRVDDTFKPFESTFKPYTGVVADSATGVRTSTRMCFMMARPYQMASTSLMDSYLEHYTTNIRLEKKLARLKAEAEVYHRSTQSTPRASVENADTTTQRVTFRMGPPASIAVMSRKRSYSASTTSTKPQVDSVMGDMGIEITTSRLETVTQTGAWTAKPRKQQKKQEPTEEFLCTECGTVDSPEWRRGPHGVKTLCNACGLRWSKAQKKSCSSSQKEGELSQ